jgi:hypothetical protein
MDHDNTNRFTLFRNKDRKTDGSPEYSGSINIDGVEYRLGAWVKEGKNGRFFSGSVRPKDQRPKGSMTVTSGRQPSDDDIPF